MVEESGPRKGRRGPWRVLLPIVALLLIAAAAGGYVYLNRSTPDKTLQAFCAALQQNNYHDAYTKLSTPLQHITSEQSFAAIFSQDKITQCTYGPTSEYASSTTTDLQLMHVSRKKNTDLITLIKDETNEWKIADVRRT